MLGLAMQKVFDYQKKKKKFVPLHVTTYKNYIKSYLLRHILVKKNQGWQL